MDPDWSHASRALWWSGSICVCGSGLFTRGFCFPSCFLEFLATYTHFLATWTPVRFKFLTKNVKKLSYVSWFIFSCFAAFSHFFTGIKMGAMFFSLNLCIFVFFGKFLAWFLCQFNATWSQYLWYNFVIIFAHDSMPLLLFECLDLGLLYCK